MIARRRTLVRRRQVTRVRRVARIIEALICVSVLGGFGYAFVKYAEGSRDFRVRRVAIDGLHYLDEGTVLAASGIAPDGNVFAFDEATVKSRIEALPYVEHCEVSRVYPDTVAIAVRERVPAASLHVGRRVYEIDRSGVVLREYAPAEMPIDPFVTEAPGVEFVHPGQSVAGTPAGSALHTALAIWDHVNASTLARQLRISELAALRGDDVRMFCSGEDYEIRWGGGDIEEMTRRLEVLWRRFDGHLPCAEYVDLRFGADVACK
jgi:hypothetical protein